MSMRIMTMTLSPCRTSLRNALSLVLLWMALVVKTSSVSSSSSTAAAASEHTTGTITSSGSRSRRTIHPHYDFPRPMGTVDAVYDLLDRVLGIPEAKESIRLVLAHPETEQQHQRGYGWFRLEQVPVIEVKSHRGYHIKSKEKIMGNTNHNSTPGRPITADDSYQSPSSNNDNVNNNIQIVITGTSMSEITAGLGFYLKEYCNFTIEWSTGGRGGGSHIDMPSMDRWPIPLSGTSNNNDADSDDRSLMVIHRDRIVPWSYLINVCTHSYSLVWYDWAAWESLIDNLALRGINMILALTGQEEIQYKVFRKLGLNSSDIRSWFNGPAFLTWSRGQNEYGSGIAGPLPRSFMRAQWKLQKDHILPRLRSLGIVGQLPAFQGNVPIQLKTLYQDANITEQDATGWMDSLDPLYGTIADMWMTELINDFGTDHYYQIDGYFNGGTAPWFQQQFVPGNNTEWPRSRNNFVEGVRGNVGLDHLRGLSAPSIQYAATTEATNDDARIQQQQQQQEEEQAHDDTWYRRGQAVYEGLSRTDPRAHWMYQGFSFVGWDTTEQASFLKGFVDSAPLGKFMVIDMAYSPDGEWQKWNNASFFGAPFIWSKLHNFGDTTGMRGDMHHLNAHFPYQAIGANSSIVGIGATPEGIDQNPIYYEFLYEQAFRQQPVVNLTSHIIHMNYKRYDLMEKGDDVKLDVSHAWGYLMETSYAQDFSVQDGTGVAHLSPREGGSLFESDRRTPKPILCGMSKAWIRLVEAAQKIQSRNITATSPFLFDLVNVGREVLAQLTTPMALNFSDARIGVMDRQELTRTGMMYIDLLLDLDRLVGTIDAFQLVPWLKSAKRLAESDDAGVQFDCLSPILSNSSGHADGDCRRFYEWNARCQITTWNPTASNAGQIPGGPIDYAAKHWSGLIGEYYAERARILLLQALRDQDHGSTLNDTAVQRRFAQHAYEWSTNTTSSTTAKEGDPPSRSRRDCLRSALAVSKEMVVKYSEWFETCWWSDRTIQ